ncbi:carbamoyl phosphate synthase large subunit [Candidatus Peregrinibacteria bacterium CG11_big_fil_rev_8_21_14_0_20_46_8]|nr:MAG: carbamoyl phosphate synthase large subunit [Candidatus Peregrinibacteria bacterium CG11_big_fil_rev_8_21_14_0_20_46_8]
MPKKSSARQAGKISTKKRSAARLKKILVLGSGALKIGEAGEFDYSGSQAIKALKEEKISTVLVNPNIATNQTSKDLADEVYFLPVDPYFVEKVIEKEKPDGVLLSFGGQTALNCGVALEQKGVFAKHGVRVLGTPVKAIEMTEDRQLFKEVLKKVDVKTPKSFACNNKAAALKAAKKIGYPVILRAAYALGGKGSGTAHDEKTLKPMIETAFAFSPQVLIEEDLTGWKEVEYEIVRDAYDNCITVCNMENIDPLGIHTGESIVIAPSQTLTNEEYHFLREISIRVIREIGIIGECNIQFALDPKSLEYRVIEVNARLSRSSALASKATGYPLAHVAAKLALGYALPDIKNAVTKTTSACFEPALDYVALKIPRWDLDKFKKVSQEISTEMKSVGEIMALGRSFEEVLQKGLRMLQIGLLGFAANKKVKLHFNNLQRDIKVATPKRILAIADALRKGWSTKKIARLSGIDPWFLDKMKNIIDMEKRLAHERCTREDLYQAKRYGFSDKQIGNIIEQSEQSVRALRKKMKVLPSIKQIDTMAAEFPAQTNYLYVTYHGIENDIKPDKRRKKIMVLGSGAYAIGTSVEFDWCSVTCVKTLEKLGYETIMVNYNPETVSTDYDTCSKLYFDELSLERVLDIYETEKPEGVVISTGGQVPNNLAMKLHAAGVKILGTSPRNIDRAEDRHKFSALCDELKIDQPQWRSLSSLSQIKSFAKDVGYPLLVRPSYVLSGAAMSVAQNIRDLENFLGKAAEISTEAPVVVSKFETGAKEIEIDAVAHKGQIVIYAISEHIENAGVHSGDATMVMPPQKLYFETIKRITSIAQKIARELEISGPFNMQFLAKNNDVKVIECNLRSSRSFPFASKVTGYNFIEIATYAMLHAPEIEKIKTEQYHTLDMEHVGVKAPQFSFSRLKGADPVLGVEMASTGEVACFGDDMYEALLKAMISTGFTIPKKSICLTIGKLENKLDLLPTVKKLVDMNFELYATEGTAKFLRQHKIRTKILHKARAKKKPNIIDYIADKKIDLVIDIPKSYRHEDITDGYLIRRRAVDSNIPLITNVQIARIVIEAIRRYSADELRIKSWKEYVA